MSPLTQLIDDATAAGAPIDPHEAQALFACAEAVALDIREAHEHGALRIAGSLHAPRSNLEWYLDPGSADYLSPLARRPLLVVVCGSGKRSALSLATLRQFGLHGRVLAGGIRAWKEAGLPVEIAQEESTMNQPAHERVTRHEVGPRMSQLSVAGGVAYLAGQVADDAIGKSTADQARQIFAKIDRYLATAGSSKSAILQVTIYLADMADYAEFNAAWDAWIDPRHPPSRACLQTPLARPEWRVELVLTAACGG
jgi:enamine deaminase RidA (YjgF/YER057c/UK114 family)